MEDFDLFTNEINFTKPFYKKILNKFVYDVPTIPNGPNYQCARKLIAEECLAANNDAGCAFHLSEAVSATLRTMADYRYEQLTAADDKLYMVKSFVKPMQDLIDSNPIPDDDDNLLDFLQNDTEVVMNSLKSFQIDEKLPLHRRYLRFTKENNIENFQKILKELPKEWTIIQITAPYTPNENLKPFEEYRTDIKSLFLSVFTNDYLNDTELGPFTINVPANITKVGEKPLLTELYSVLEENYKIIDNAQFLNNKRLVQNYWSRREDIDLRMKSVINKMDKDWLGGWGSLLTGKLIDKQLKEKIVQVVDNTISDWGFIKLTQKQKILLYNLIECCPQFTSQQTKTCIRRILTEHGNPEDIRRTLPNDCPSCTKDFQFLYELCLKCLSKCFEVIHHFTLVDGIRAFSQTVTLVKDSEEWGLKKARRYPVILIVDEMLDSFPWETLPIINQHPVSRMENIHFTYYLYKIHEKNIVDGYFAAKCDVGRYVINPEKNLDRMEKRMTSFVEYWCPTWSGHVAEPPPPEQFLEHLATADLFLYCGHGDGCHFANGANGGIEGARSGRAVCVLSGCGSVRLARGPRRAPPTASHHHLHIAGFPMVVGMLWEVTDLEVDKVVSTLLSLYVPSENKMPWPSVGKAKWSQGILDTSVEQKSSFIPESDLLRAVSRARGSTNFVIIASSMVARGLPVRIQ